MAEDDDIDRAQQRLEAARARLGITPPTAADAAREASWKQGLQVRRDETLAEILARLPATLTCPDPADQRAEARTDAAIPDALRGITWRRLVDLRGPEGAPSLGGVLDQRGRHLVGAAAVAELRRVFAGPASRIVLLGDTRAGKSVSAAAACDGDLRAGRERVRWANAVDLRTAGAIDRASGAGVLYLDDLGEELGIATRWGEPRASAVSELVGRLARRRGVRLVVSTYLSHEAMRAPSAYGDAVAARVYEGAAVVRVVRA